MQKLTDEEYNQELERFKKAAYSKNIPKTLACRSRSDAFADEREERLKELKKVSV